MQAIIPISLKRIAVTRMQTVERGTLTFDEAVEAIRKARVSREQIVNQLTRWYDPETVKAFRFFRLL